VRGERGRGAEVRACGASRGTEARERLAGSREEGQPGRNDNGGYRADWIGKRAKRSDAKVRASGVRGVRRFFVVIIVWTSSLLNITLSEETADCERTRRNPPESVVQSKRAVGLGS